MAAKHLEYLCTSAKGSEVYDCVLIEANVRQYELRALSWRSVRSNAFEPEYIVLGVRSRRGEAANANFKVRAA